MNLWQPLKDGKFTCLYIICKSFILNANLIDQVTPGGRDKHTHHTHTHPHMAFQTSSLSVFKPCQTAPTTTSPLQLLLLCCWQQEVSRVTAHPEHGQLAGHTQNRGQACVNWRVEASWGALPVHCACCSVWMLLLMGNYCSDVRNRFRPSKIFVQK